MQLTTLNQCGGASHFLNCRVQRLGAVEHIESHSREVHAALGLISDN
jgi:hypothetical protein